MFTRLFLALLFVLLGWACPAVAQVNFLEVYFGKNLVNWEDKDWRITKTEHFDIHHKFDLGDPNQAYHLEKTAGFLEDFYLLSGKIFKHELGKRVDVILVATHQEMESSNILQDPFMPETPQGIVDPYRNRISVKEDYYPYFRATINLHELVHIFQLDIRPRPRMQVPFRPHCDLPRGFYEGGADFVVSLHRPYDRDDIFLRRRGPRLVPAEFIPTWEALKSSRPGEFLTYIAWRVVHSFLEEEFAQGVNFQAQGLRTECDKLGELIFKLTEGKLGNPDVNPEVFNRAFKEYWVKTYKLEQAKRPKPLEETVNFRGRSVIPYWHKESTLAPVVSPDGKELFVLTEMKNGPILAKLSIPLETDSPEEREEKRRLVNWTPYFPPRPWEYLVQDTLFNGSSLAYSRDGKKIALFARKNRDHMLFVLDAAEPGKILEEIEIPFDQAFGLSWSSDGKKIYFSAAEDATRDIYVLDLETGDFTNLTHDLAFDTGPAISPDGSRLVYVSSDGDSENEFQHLWLLDLATGRREQLTFGRFHNIMPVWSHDGKRIFYVSDEADWIWNLYTLDFETDESGNPKRIVSQWTNFPGGVANPVPAPDNPNKVFASILWDSDKTPPLGEDVFELTLKTPIRQYKAVDKGESGQFVFTDAALSKRKLDPRQLENPSSHPKKWQIGRAAGFAAVSTNPYYGGFAGGGFLAISDILENHHHVFGFLTNYDYKEVNYLHLNLAKRLKWGFNVSFSQLPLRYQLWDLFGGYPQDQPLLNLTWLRQSSIGAFVQRPVNKFERLEAGVEFRGKSFAKDPDLVGYFLGLDPLTPGFSDEALTGYLTDSTGTAAVFKGCYVRDTVLGSYATLGPFHGNALSACAELAPPAGNLLGYAGFKLHGRRYQYLGGRTLVALRGDAVFNGKNGEVILMGGDHTLRGFPRLSLAGNQAIYGSAELRFPLLEGIVFPAGFGAIAPVRGALFADWGRTGFAKSPLPAQQGKAVGGLAQFPPLPFLGIPLNVVVAWTNQDGFRERRIDAVLAYGW